MDPDPDKDPYLIRHSHQTKMVFRQPLDNDKEIVFIVIYLIFNFIIFLSCIIHYSIIFLFKYYEIIFYYFFITEYLKQSVICKDVDQQYRCVYSTSNNRWFHLHKDRSHILVLTQHPP